MNRQRGSNSRRRTEENSDFTSDNLLKVNYTHLRREIA